MPKIKERKIQILKLIVEEYLKTGEIMGSKNLLKKYDLQVSSATIRNDMLSLSKKWALFFSHIILLEDFPLIVDSGFL